MGVQNDRSHCKVAMLAGAGAAVLSVATAQTPAPAGRAPAAAVEELQEVTVTGSRVITNGNDSPTPVTVVVAEDLTTTHPTNLAEALNDMPVFGFARGQASGTGAGSAASSPATSVNATNVLNLRSLGYLRTLILFDGHRAPPSTPDGFVDSDTIPQMLIQRVDVVTGGASAVYGSDAVSGVVNFITDTRFQGIKANLQSGISKYSDGSTMQGGIAVGTGLFGGRGHLLASYSNRHDGGIPVKSTREWAREYRALAGLGTAASPYYQAFNTRQNNQTVGGKINNGTLIDTQFASGGFLVPFVHGTLAPTAAGTLEVLGDGGLNEGQLRAKLDMNQLYGRFDFDFTDNLHGYLMVADVMNHSIGLGGYFASNNLSMRRDNAFLLPQYQAQLTTANQTTFTFGKIFSGFPRGQVETYSKQILFNAGLQGSFGNGYKWDLSYMKGDGRFDVRTQVTNQGRLYAALDSVLSNGAAVCRAALTNPTYAGCVPVNPFGIRAETNQAAISYIYGRAQWITDFGSDDFSASVTGAPFNTWAGPVNAALSAEWRKLTYGIKSDSLPTTRADCTGILNTTNCTATTVFYSSSVTPAPTVSRSVSEAAVEFGVPLLKDSAFAKSIDLNAAYRFAHYQVAGNANTWKLGLTWDLNGKVTLRTTRSRDFRAPSLDEAFRPQALNLTTFADRMPGTAVPNPGPLPTENGGNPNLKPEIADTLTYGVVWRPTANFSLALDAFDIKVKDSIFIVQGNAVSNQDICYASGGTSPYCQLIVRALGSYTDTSAANRVVGWKQSFINLVEQNTYGADLEANYRTSIFGRQLNLRALATYQPHIIYQQPGLANFDYGGVAVGTNGIGASPAMRITTFINFKPTDQIAVGLQARWRGPLKYSADPAAVVSSPRVRSVAFTNVNLNYSPKVGFGTMDLFLNVSNLFNTAPPPAGFFGNQAPGATDSVNGDDVVGRYYTAGVRFRL
jgi:outer membrane receptor protein involved in Fe transport